ncbi:MAG: hypothetical protein SFW07_01470 [Gammaproteobacteria bacterium]|nr:hypothetical protein [Gammaproteobacteria bacterium]
MNTKLIFIAIDWGSFNYFKRLKNACLFYRNLRSLSFCYQQEIWVLYSNAKYFECAMRFARRVQQAGSYKILMILINASLSSGEN